MSRVSIAPLIRVNASGSHTDQDLVAVEAPLSIEVRHSPAVDDTNLPDTITPLGVFMRTPGDDEALALGLLFAEGIIRNADDVTSMTVADTDADGSATIAVTLARHVMFDPAMMARAGVATTACGLCGKLNPQIEPSMRRAAADTPVLAPDVIFQLPDRLRHAQAVFEKTGGLHAAAFVDRSGHLLDVAEDIGRHNAVDKLVGRALRLSEAQSPSRDRILLVSSRVAYEIVQKAAMAGVHTLIAVGAPSSLAVRAARDAGITLIGFVKDGSFNVYG